MPKLQLSLTTYVHVARVQILIQQLRAPPLSQGHTQYAVIPAPGVGLCKLMKAGQL